MTTDFNYGNKTINASGPIKPSGKDMPSDPRARVNTFADIANIPVPYVGMLITVLQDETNSGKMTDYKVKSLKANSLGSANSLVDEVVRYVDYLGASSGGSISQEDINTAVNNYLTEHPVTGGATAEQAAQIEANKTAIGDKNSGLIKGINDIKNIELQSLNTAIQTLETLVGLDQIVGDGNGLPSGDANIIASINRIDEKPTGSVTDEQVNTAIDNYFSEHPPIYDDGLIFSNNDVVRSINANVDETIIKQEYLGGYIEVQPDSWDGVACSTDNTTKTWGFPYSLLPTERKKIKDDILHGKGTNIMYIRFPLGFAYRGFRNIDETTHLAKNIGERFKGQNATLKEWFKDISISGGGLAPEYWCPAPYWVTTGTYSGSNQLRAGGSYSVETTLASIKDSDISQYNAQIEAFTNAIIDDLEYLHQNIAPVRMFCLQNEPSINDGIYGSCKYDSQTYNDVLEVLYPKIQASNILSEYNDEKNEVKLLVGSDIGNTCLTGVVGKFIENHSDMIWGYTHHTTRVISGESVPEFETGAEYYKTDGFKTLKGDKTNLILNEYEYFGSGRDDNFRCSNNMLKLINELIYAEAKILHPVIHICKPLGQSLSSTNTKGYCLYATNLKGEYGLETANDNNQYNLLKGTAIPNETMYNSWALFGDNLPIGAYVVSDYSAQISGASWCVCKYSGKIYLFIANNTKDKISIKLSFSSAKRLIGKYYDLKECGAKIAEKNGATIEFIVPPFSGQFWTEPSHSYSFSSDYVLCESITLSDSNITISDSYTLTATTTPSNTTESISWKSDNVSIASITNGVIKPIKNGQCTITATCGTCKATCIVTVEGMTTQENLAKNLTYKTGISINSSTGNEESSDNKICTDYIKVINNSYNVIFIDDSNSLFNSYKISLYDTNKTYISSQQLSNNYAVKDLSCEYIRIVSSLTTQNDYDSIANTRLVINNQEFTLNNSSTSNPSKGDKLYNCGYINDSNNVVKSTKDYYLSELLEISNSQITVTYDSSSISADVTMIRINEYDESKNFIKRQYTTNVSNPTFLLDTSTKYITVGTQFSKVMDSEPLYDFFNTLNVTQ